MGEMERHPHPPTTVPKVKVTDLEHKTDGCQQWKKGGCRHRGDSWEKLIRTNTEKSGIQQGPPAERGW